MNLETHILLRCPTCKNELEVERVGTDYPEAVRVEVTCPECNAGDFAETMYYDTAGKHITRDMDTKDELYDKAVRFVRTTGKTRISSLQLQFQTGYNRTARMIEAMESEGIVSAPDYRGARQLLPANTWSDLNAELGAGD